MSSTGGIGGGGGSIRLAVVQSLARQTPKTSFGSVMRDGLSSPGAGAAPAPFQATPALTATLEDLVAAFFEVEAYARLNSPRISNDLARVRAQLQALAARSG